MAETIFRRTRASGAEVERWVAAWDMVLTPETGAAPGASGRDYSGRARDPMWGRASALLTVHARQDVGQGLSPADGARSIGCGAGLQPCIGAASRPEGLPTTQVNCRSMPCSVGIACLLVVMGIALSQPPLRAANGPGMKKAAVAHRGASAYAPEHTLEAYRLAMEQGAEFVEQDLAVTKDGVLVCIHDLTLDRTTNVEDVFPARFSEHTSGTNSAPRWLVADFTLAEIKQLDAGSWFDSRFAAARIPTFQEAIDLVKGKAGLYPELKDPAFYRERSLSPERLLAAALEQSGLAADPRTPLVIQSFDEATIKTLATALPTVPRVWLMELGAAARVDAAGK